MSSASLRLMRSWTVRRSLRKPLRSSSAASSSIVRSAAVAQVVDVVDVPLALAQVEDVADRVDEVLGVQGHLVLGDRLVELAVDAEAADLAEAVAVRVEELLVEELAGLLQLRRVAGPEPLVDPQQRVLVVARSGPPGATGGSAGPWPPSGRGCRPGRRRPGPAPRSWRWSSRSRSGPRRSAGRRRRRRRSAPRAWRRPWGRRCRPSRSRRRPGGSPRRWRTAGLIARRSVIAENLPDWSIRTPRVVLLGDRAARSSCRARG